MGSNDKIKNLFKWCLVQAEDHDIEIKNFTTSWRNGIAFCAILQNYTKSINIKTLCPDDVYKNCELAFRIGEEEFEIPQLLEPNDMVALKCPDRLSIITYLFTVYSKLYQLEKRPNSVFNSIENMTNKLENIKVVTPDETLKVTDENKDIKEEQENIPSSSETEILPTKCIICLEPVFMLEKFTIADKMYHRKCYRQNQLDNLKKRNLTLERPKINSTIPEKINNNEEESKVIKSQSDNGIKQNNQENHQGDTTIEIKVDEDNNCNIGLINNNVPTSSISPPVPDNNNRSASLENIADESSNNKSNLKVKNNLASSNDSLNKSHGSNLSINSNGSNREAKKRHAPLPPPSLARKPEKPIPAIRPKSCKPPTNKPAFKVENRNTHIEQKKDTNIEYPDDLNPFGFDENNDTTELKKSTVESDNNKIVSSKPPKNDDNSKTITKDSVKNDPLTNKDKDLLNPFQEFMENDEKEKEEKEKEKEEKEKEKEEKEKEKEEKEKEEKEKEKKEREKEKEEKESKDIPLSVPKPVVRKKFAPKLPSNSEKLETGTSKITLNPKHSAEVKVPDSFSSNLPSQLRDNSISSNFTRQSRMSSMSSKHPAPSRPIPPKRQVRGDVSCKWVPFDKIYSELEEINQKQTEIEARGRTLQNKLWEAQNQDDAFEDMLQDWLDLVNEKNDLFTVEKTLHEKLKQQELEERHSDLEHELRLLLAKQESLKTASETAREEELINQILETVNKRSELIEGDVEYPITNQDLKKPKKSKSTLKKIFSLKRSASTSKTLTAKKTSQFYGYPPSANDKKNKLFKNNTITE